MAGFNQESNSYKMMKRHTYRRSLTKIYLYYHKLQGDYKNSDELKNTMSEDYYRINYSYAGKYLLNKRAS